jgi:hypothetical protein
VFSDRGIWISHFWETDNISNPEGFQASLDFLQNGGLDFPSLVSVVEQYFGDDALFVKAIIWTPDERRPRRAQVFPDRTGKSPSDAVWYPQVAAMTAKIKEIIPRLAQPKAGELAKSQVSTITYQVFSTDEQGKSGFPPEWSVLAVEYVPANFHIDQAGKCSFARALRLHSQGQTTGAIIWPWVTAPAKRSIEFVSDKRAVVGACPANIEAGI